MLWTNSTTEARVSLREYTPTLHIDLAELAEQARTSSRRELVSLIERRQEKIVEELCGPTTGGHLEGGTTVKGVLEIFITDILGIDVLLLSDYDPESDVALESWYKEI